MLYNPLLPDLWWNMDLQLYIIKYTKMKQQQLTTMAEQINSMAAVELVKAKDAVDQFIYSCSHTLRGPLKSITGLINIFKQSKGKTEMDSEFLITSIENSVKKMELVLRDLEQFLANSKRIVTSQAVDVKDAAKVVLKTYKQQINKEKIRINLRVHQPCGLQTDRNRLEVILSHLLLNAIQYHDDGKNESQISIHIKVSPKVCYIQVSDNGIGIHEDVLPHIFELFYRGTERSTGAGVGLYIAKEILGKMGGSIRIKSKHHLGTTAFLSIPNMLQ